MTFQHISPQNWILAVAWNNVFEDQLEFLFLSGQENMRHMFYRYFYFFLKKIGINLNALLNVIFFLV